MHNLHMWDDRSIPSLMEGVEKQSEEQSSKFRYILIGYVGLLRLQFEE